MTDPLKNKFKSFTFKLYDKELRHNKDYFDTFFQTFQEDPLITVIDSWYDYCPHVGIHKNGVFRSTSYKQINAKYSCKDTKLSGLYLHFDDIKDMHSYNAWIIYSIRRQDTNYKYYLPKQITLPQSPINSPSTFPSTPPKITF